MKFFTKLENKIKRKPPPPPPFVDTPFPPIVNVEPTETNTFQWSDSVPWTDPVEPAPRVGPIELDSTVPNPARRRVFGDDDTTPQQYRLVNGGSVAGDQQHDSTFEERNERRRQAQLEAEREQRRRKTEQAYAERIIAERQNNASTRNVRRLRRLIREKYALDVEVWNKRHVQAALRPHIAHRAARSDAILQEIVFIVGEWDRQAFEDREEWMLAKSIKDEFEQGGSQDRPWGDMPPWEREDDESDGADGASVQSWEG